MADAVKPKLRCMVRQDARGRFFLVEGAITTMQVFKRFFALAVIFLCLPVCGGALAAQPQPWEMNLQPAATEVMAEIAWFHTVLLVIIAGITLFVLGLLLVVIIKFNAKANPVPSKTTHNTLLELAWTVLPVAILTFIAVPSFRLLHTQLNIPPADVTVKATGKQWFWSYSYPDAGGFEFDSLMLSDKERKPGQPRLLAVDNEMVVPVNKNIRVVTTGADVIHAFAVPSFGIKIDSIPGRINETWFKALREGVYYGQCSELCGKDHAFMPIAVRVVSDGEYAAWLDQAKKKYASDNGDRSTAAAGKTATR